MTKTAHDLISDALLQSGIIPQENANIPAYMINQGFSLLNDIINEWGSDPGLIPYQKVVSFNFVANQQTYTFGLGDEYDVNTDPIVDVVALTYFINSQNNIKFNVQPMNEPMYANILYTGVSTYPAQYLLRLYPKHSTIEFQPLPQSNYAVTLVCKQRINPVELYQDLEVQFPPGFLLALKYRLMLDIANAFSFTLDASFGAKATKTLAAMRGNNKFDLAIRKTESLNANRTFFSYAQWWS
jgi:hypothetical protein